MLPMLVRGVRYNSNVETVYLHDAWFTIGTFYKERAVPWTGIVIVTTTTVTTEVTVTSHLGHQQDESKSHPSHLTHPANTF